jgi:hypothetical protein
MIAGVIFGESSWGARRKQMMERVLGGGDEWGRRKKRKKEKGGEVSKSGEREGGRQGTVMMRGRSGEEATAAARAIAKRKASEPARKQLTAKAKQKMVDFFGQYVSGMHDGSKEMLKEVAKMARWTEFVRSPATVKAYLAAYGRVSRWLEERGLSVMPIPSFACARYLSALAYYCEEKKLTKSNVLIACAAIKWRHEAVGELSPTNSPLVVNIKKGMSKALGVRGWQKSPITDEDMQRWYWERVVASGRDILELVMLMRLGVMKEGLLRYDCFRAVEWWDIIITTEEIRVFVGEAKTSRDKREGQWVTLLAPSRPTPWSAYTLLMEVADRLQEEWNALTGAQQKAWGKRHPGVVNISSEGETTLALNRVLVMCKLGKGYGRRLPVAGAIGYGTFVKLIKKWATSIGHLPKDYASHSCRRGGATSLKMRGVPDTLIMEMGRWRSKESMQLYFDWNTEMSVRVAAVRAALGARVGAGLRLEADEGLYVNEEEMGEVLIEMGIEG